MKEINFKKIEKKWQKTWEEEKAFEVKDGKGKKYYVLDMFAYPSGEGLHMGHSFVFSLGDVYARFKRMQGFNVLYPVGYDALGLPAENAAINAGTPPKEYTKKSIGNFMKQQKAMGWSYDWSRLVNTSEHSYYKWDQWIFLKMLEKGIAYRKEAPVNYCKRCNTVLANEQVINGKCWRHEDTEVEIRHLEQWFLKTTKYADLLLNGIEKLNWPDRAKRMQKNWIGRSEGTEIIFKIKNENWPVFTTRPDTLMGVTFMVVSAQHPKLMEFVGKKERNNVEKFLKELKSTAHEDIIKLEKEGVFTGAYAKHPITDENIPIYAGNFVLAEYGSGMVMSVPAHDQRDFEFAKKYKIPIKLVIRPGGEFVKQGEDLKEAYTGSGMLINSNNFDGLKNVEAKVHITNALEIKKLGGKTVNYKLRDWLISRQRYWGTPIPIIYCKDCGIIPVLEKDLPVILPEKVEFGDGNPLAKAKGWVNVDCPKCGKKGKRETDTMDTFANSSWYYLRYADPKNDKEIFNKKKADYWMPIDQYIGGPEHITAHLIYVRFYTKFLKDLGILKFDEPALKYFTQGLVYGSDGEKMSKSKGNVVEPMEMIERFGADSLRFYLLSNGSSDSDFSWDPKGMVGANKFIRKIYGYFSGVKFGKSSKRIESKINCAIGEITSEVEGFRHNIALIKLRALLGVLEGEKEIGKVDAFSYLKLLSVYCPHIAEELWKNIGGKGLVSLSSWPKADEGKIDEDIEKQEKEIEKTLSDITNILGIVKDKGEEIKMVHLYVIPKELEGYDSEILGKRVGYKVVVWGSNDPKKHDPEGKAKKAKPGKPGIYVE
jgi:leucyl-tRNA synthetase